MKKNIIYITASLLLTLASLITSCKGLIYDDLSGCPGGLYVQFYSQTECAEKPSYPQDIKLLDVFVFDQDNILVQHRQIQNPPIDKNYKLYIPIKNTGKQYSTVAYTGLESDLFDVKDIQPGITTKQSILASLKQTGKIATTDLRDKIVRMGSSANVLVASVDDAQSTNQAHATVNLRELTNRVSVSLLLQAGDQPQNYSIELASCNATYLYDGTIPVCDSTYYPTKMSYNKDSGTASAFFTTLKLEGGNKSTLIVHNTKTGKEVYREDLVQVILNSSNADKIKLQCINDFDIKLKIKSDNTKGYVVAELWINSWLVHSYETSLDPNS